MLMTDCVAVTVLVPVVFHFILLSVFPLYNSKGSNAPPDDLLPKSEIFPSLLITTLTSGAEGVPSRSQIS